MLLGRELIVRGARLLARIVGWRIVITNEGRQYRESGPVEETLEQPRHCV